MSIRLFALSLFLAAGLASPLPAPAFAAAPTVGDYDQDGRPHTLGSAEFLAGDVYVLSCFVSDADNQWTDNERTSMIALMYEAQGWLREQAADYGVALEFVNDSFGLEKDIELDAVPSMREEGAKSIVTTVLQEIGYRSSLDFYIKTRKRRADCDNITVLIFVKDSGTSYAVPYTDPDAATEFYTEGAVIYQRYDTIDAERPAGAIAHEILHTFGAWELYNVYYHEKDVETLAHELFPDSIMHEVHFDINDSSVDEVTAWLIGWHDQKETWYEHFNPRRGISEELFSWEEDEDWE